jgi:hypothetical protein
MTGFKLHITHVYSAIDPDKSPASEEPLKTDAQTLEVTLPAYSTYEALADSLGVYTRATGSFHVR